MLKQYLNVTVDLEISGEQKIRTGILIDIGQDIIVIYDGSDFLYVPLHHIQHIKTNQAPDEEIENPDFVPIESDKEITYRNILHHARGLFTEIFVAGNQSVHGYITSIMSNYFVFYSPVFHTMYIPMFHLKWLTPYPSQQTPYSLSRTALPVNPSNLPLSRSFEEQLVRLEGKIVVFDLGTNANKIGLLMKVQNNMAELVTAKEKRVYWNIHHLKTVHCPQI